MAKIIKRERGQHKELFIVLDKGEVVNLIGLLSALLGGVSSIGNPVGAIPSFSMSDEENKRFGELYITLKNENDS